MRTHLVNMIGIKNMDNNYPGSYISLENPGAFVTKEKYEAHQTRQKNNKTLEKRKSYDRRYYLKKRKNNILEQIKEKETLLINIDQEIKTKEKELIKDGHYFGFFTQGDYWKSKTNERIKELNDLTDTTKKEIIIMKQPEQQEQEEQEQDYNEEDGEETKTYL